MNESEFEKALGALRPTAPSPRLAGRIEEQLAAPPICETELLLARPPRQSFLPRLLRDFGWACAGAAAALAAIALFHRHDTTEPRPATPSAALAEADTFEHAEMVRELVSTEDSSELFETDEGPVRQVRYSYLERHAWANPRTGARVEIEVPREDVYLLPVAMQ